MTSIQSINDEQKSVFAAAGGMLASIVAGAACIGPLVGITLGVSNLGWLSQLSYLTVPASIASVALLLAAFYLFARRKSSCADYRKHMLNRSLLGTAAVVIASIHFLEYIIFPALG